MTDATAMNPTVVGILVFAFTLAGALAGMWLQPHVPAHHLNDSSRETIKLGIGLIATMTALVLGLVTASAKTAFDTVDAAVRHAAMDVLTLDRVLARYGPETGEARAALQQTVDRRIEMIWPSTPSAPAQLDVPTRLTNAEVVADRIRALTPRDEAQRGLQTRALDLAEALLSTRWLMSTGKGTSVAFPFLVILLFWLTITFASFGLLAPRNATVVAVLLVCAISVGSAMFLIFEMDGPFDGVLKVSADPLRYASTNSNR